MDEQLKGYINSQASAMPVINERKLVEELEKRKKRLYLILFSLAGLLWAIALYSVSLLVDTENQTAGITLLIAISVGYMCAGCFAGIVVKFRKVGI